MFTTDKSKLNVLMGITFDNWVLSIARDKNSSNEQHAFILLEGLSGTKSLMKKYDLYIKRNEQGVAEAKLTDSVPSIIVKEEIEGTPSEVRKWFIDNIADGADLRFESWNINDEQAEKLQAAIEADIANPPPYYISGDKSLSAKSSGIKNAHNCFSWAREKLNNLGDERINIPSKYSDFIAAATSKYIKGKAIEAAVTIGK